VECWIVARMLGCLHSSLVHLIHGTAGILGRSFESVAYPTSTTLGVLLPWNGVVILFEAL